MLVRGRRWRISDGMSVKVWSEPWVARIDNLSSYSKINIEEMRDYRVISLLGSQTKR